MTALCFDLSPASGQVHYIYQVDFTSKDAGSPARELNHKLKGGDRKLGGGSDIGVIARSYLGDHGACSPQKILQFRL